MSIPCTIHGQHTRFIVSEQLLLSKNFGDGIMDVTSHSGRQMARQCCQHNQLLLAHDKTNQVKHIELHLICSTTLVFLLSNITQYLFLQMYLP